jgi:hypothetical protein
VKLITHTNWVQAPYVHKGKDSLFEQNKHNHNMGLQNRSVGRLTRGKDFALALRHDPLQVQQPPDDASSFLGPQLLSYLCLFIYLPSYLSYMHHLPLCFHFGFHAWAKGTAPSESSRTLKEEEWERKEGNFMGCPIRMYSACCILMFSNELLYEARPWVNQSYIITQLIELIL